MKTLIFVTAIICIFACILLLIKIFMLDKESNKLSDDFQEAKNFISMSMQSQKRELISNLESQAKLNTLQLEKEFEDKTKILEGEMALKETNLKQQYFLLEKELKNNYQQSKAGFQEQIQRVQKENVQKIQEETDKYNYEIQSIQQNYAAAADEIEVKKEKALKSLEQIKEELSNYQKIKEDTIDRLKKDEEIKQQQQFYHITLDDDSQSDITKLKNLALSFSKPKVLYKIVYEVYYKVKLEELFKRILGDNKDKGGIYKITNINNSKVYIGRTTNFLTRWRTHAKRALKAEEGSLNRLYQFMWDEGIENFTFEIVEICEKDKQPEREKYWIDFYKSQEWGYNTQSGG